MKERLLENWLDSATERTFETAFCSMLVGEGYTVVHMTRHTGMELGKDILAIDPDGVPCAFQLKSASGKRITLGQWRGEIQGQVIDLIHGKIVHPSIPAFAYHRSLLVTNRDLDEEVSRAIDDLNRASADRNQPEFKLETIVRGQLLKMAMDHASVVWPSELPDVKLLLELFLNDGRGPLPRDKVACLMETTMGLHNMSSPSKAELQRAVASSAFLCALATSSWSRADNYCAEIDGWVVYVAAMLAASERFGLAMSDIRPSFEIAVETILQLLGGLCDELRARSHMVEGNALADPPVLSARVTQLVGFMSVYGLWLKASGTDPQGGCEFAREFCLKYEDKMLLWGEGAVPNYLAYFWFLKEVDGTPKSDVMLMSILEALAVFNGKTGPSFADPYQQVEDVFLGRWELEQQGNQIAAEPSGTSYMAKGLLHLLAKRDWKHHLKAMWPDITRLGFLQFEPAQSWQYYIWRSENGTNIDERPPLTKKWEDLRGEAYAFEDTKLPALLKPSPVLMLLFLITYPHRVTSDAVKWLDRSFRHF